MGIFDEYGVNMGEVKENSWEVPDDIYEFVVGSVWIQEGTKKDPNAQYFVIEYLLDDEGNLKKSEWFQLPEDPTSPTDKELQKLGFLKTRLKSLLPDASDEELNAADEDTLVGISGTLQIVTRNGYQNVKNVRVEGEPANESPDQGQSEEKVVEKPKAAPARKPAAAKAAPKQQAAAKGTVHNPFAK